jgi:hypothetical protein
MLVPMGQVLAALHAVLISKLQQPNCKIVVSTTAPAFMIGLFRQMMGIGQVFDAKDGFLQAQRGVWFKSFKDRGLRNALRVFSLLVWVDAPPSKPCESCFEIDY